jgi:general stress protein YciG
MAHSKGKGNSGNKGFGSMDEHRKREIASKGGRASAQANTSNRGFASMDKDKQREISSQGGKASQAGAATRQQRTAGGKNEDLVNRSGNDLSERDLNSLEEEDEMMSTRGLASYSETDEDEDEGVGDGNIGRSTRGDDEEG